MNDWIALGAMLLATGFAEALWPATPGRCVPRFPRWLCNIVLYGLTVTCGVALLRAVVQLDPDYAAGWTVWHHFGLLPWMGLAGWPAAIIAIPLLDAARYGWHVAQHHVPLLWRVHRVHHADPDVDVSTALRFHPLDLLFDRVIDAVLIVGLGVPPAAVALWFTLSMVANIGQHGAIALPPRLDAGLRLLFVTPAMHRVHHSSQRPETDSNYGVILSVWDRLFGSHRPTPARGLAAMTLGLDTHPAASAMAPLHMLADPFRTIPTAPPPPGDNHKTR